jgi:hypothetical protein
MTEEAFCQAGRSAFFGGRTKRLREDEPGTPVFGRLQPLLTTTDSGTRSDGALS